MNLNSVIDTAEAGMLDQVKHLNDVASDINAEDGELSKNIVELMTTQRVFEANAATVKTADEMLDVILAL